jgi:arsenate reductase (glutaredoxin)
MSQITVYEKPTCTTCRQVHKALTESGVSFDAVNYYVKPLSQTKLKELLKKMGAQPQDILRKKEAIYKQLRLAEKNPAGDELIALMAKHPDLIQRPIVEKGSKAILARPADRLKEIL